VGVTGGARELEGGKKIVVFSQAAHFDK